MFEFVFNLIFFSFKRRLASLYDESPSTINTNKMCEDKNNKEIKTELVFDEDSIDSGFSEECKQQLFENSFTNVTILHINKIRKNN